jgi:hypothetical protein
MTASQYMIYFFGQRTHGSVALRMVPVKLVDVIGSMKFFEFAW